MRWVVLAGLALGCRSARNDERPRLEHGIELVQQGEFDAGIESLRAVLAADPGDAELVVRGRAWIGEALTRAGDPRGALAEYELALELAPEDPWLHYACGVAWHTMGELERAVGCFTRALRFDPRHVKSLQWRGESRADLGELRAALGDYDLAVEVVESADEAVLASWGESMGSLLARTLELRIRALEALGENAAAARDRERLGELREGR